MDNLISFCPLLSSIPTTERQVLWTVIQNTLPWNLLVILAITIWVFLEFKTKFFRRSRNGHTKLFNQFIGSATYFSFQAFIPLALSLVFGNVIYCMLWPYVIHMFMFWFTWYFLKNIVKFWVY